MARCRSRPPWVCAPVQSGIEPVPLQPEPVEPEPDDRPDAADEPAVGEPDEKPSWDERLWDFLETLVEFILLFLTAGSS
jgi:hypothetical protein